MRKRIFVFDRREKAFRFAADEWERISAAAVKGRGAFFVAVSGGRTPLPFYAVLARRRNLPWARTHLFLVDERLVAYDSAESNYGMIRRCLLDGVGMPPGNIHPVPIGRDPESAAARYEKEIRKCFGVGEDAVPSFDLVMLGLGEDGHTASLFPRRAVLAERRRLVSHVRRRRECFARVTFTLPLLSRARTVVFLATGEKKAGAVRRVVSGIEPLGPAALVRPAGGSLVFVLDAAAA